MCVTKALKFLTRFSNRKFKNNAFYKCVLANLEAPYNKIYEWVRRIYMFTTAGKIYELT